MVVNNNSKWTEIIVLKDIFMVNSLERAKIPILIISIQIKNYRNFGETFLKFSINYGPESFAP